MKPVGPKKLTYKRLNFYGRISDIKKWLRISLNAKKNKQGCSFWRNWKTWVAVNDIGSNTASIISVMATVQMMVVEYKTFSGIATSVFTKIIAGLKQSKRINAVFDVYFDCSIGNAEQ